MPQWVSGTYRISKVIADLYAGGLVGAPVSGVLNKPAKMDFVGSQSMVGVAMAVATLLLVLVWAGRKGWTKRS